MKLLFADTANLEDIKELDSMGVISGVTTNPSIIALEPKQNYAKLLHELNDYCASSDLSLSVEVFETTPHKIAAEALALASTLTHKNLHRELYIKIPVGIEELKIIRSLTRQHNIKINCTACFTEMQLQAAVSAGADYVSFFYNRARDCEINVQRVLKRTKDFIVANNSKTQIIAGSIRSTQDIADAWDAGADIVTCSPKLIKAMVQHDGTVKAIEGFAKDFAAWRETGV